MTHEDGFELADPAPAVLVDAGREVSGPQLRLINKKLEKMDELGVKLPAQFGHRVYGEYHKLSYLKADLLIKAIIVLVADAHKKSTENKRASSQNDKYVTIPNLSRYWFDPRSFKVISKATNKPVRPVVTSSGSVVYDLYEDDKQVIASKSFKSVEYHSAMVPDHTYKTVKGKRRKMSIAILYRLSIGWTFEDLGLIK